MIEIELKILLDQATEAKLRRHSALPKLRMEPRRTEKLVSVYFDTPDHRLASKGIALRLRKVGRKWVQTIKFGKNGGAGLFSRSEINTDAPGGRLALDGPDPEGMFAAIREVSGDAALSPVFETRVQRTVEKVRMEGGSMLELALDRGEIIAGEASQPIHEAEIELLSGDMLAVYDLAQMLFPEGPIQFAGVSKAARGYRLARGEPDVAIEPRNAGTLKYDADASVESVARDVFRDCFEQITTNLVVVARTDVIEGPHQLRIGLRRLRTAFSVFSGTLGEQAIRPLSDRARDLGKAVGALRDIDVLIDELVTENTQGGLDAGARDALIRALEKERNKVRAEVRATLSQREATGFLFDLARLIEGRGWLSPADYSQTSRLAAPISDLAPLVLKKRHAKVAKRGRKIRQLDVESLHELRKELKKFRYAADIVDPIYPGKKVTAYIKSLKRLQDKFGSLNDAAMAEDYLTGDDAPGRKDPAAQRAVGWALGTIATNVAKDRPDLFNRWDDLQKVKPFWR